MNNKLQELLKNAHSPYSKVNVAAIAVTKDGTEYNGVNVENASFGATICAERSAMLSAVSQGTKAGDITEVHLTSSLSKPLFPCGMCLQMMVELMSADAKVFIYDNNEVITKSLKELLPYGVSKESFEWK